MKEILLYDSIYSYSAASIIQQIEAAGGKGFTLRINSPGGDVLAAYGMYAKFMEAPGKKNIKADGQARSAGCFFLFASDYNECLDVTAFMAHRAAFPSWIENDPERFTDAMKAELTRVNADLRSMMEKKVSNATFKAITGTSYDEMFALTSRIDVNFTAQQAKQMGLVQKINPLTAKMKNEITSLSQQYHIAAFAEEPVIAEETPINQPPKNKVMTLAEIKAQFPGLYEEIMALGRTEGIEAEAERVQTWLVFAGVDAEAVKKGIASGKAMKTSEQAEFLLKAQSSNVLGAIRAENIPAVETPQSSTTPAKTPAEAEAEAEWGQVYANLGIKDAKPDLTPAKPAVAIV